MGTHRVTPSILCQRSPRVKATPSVKYLDARSRHGHAQQLTHKEEVPPVSVLAAAVTPVSDVHRTPLAQAWMVSLTHGNRGGSSVPATLPWSGIWSAVRVPGERVSPP